MEITKLAELKNLDELLNNSEPMVSNLEDAPEKELSTKDEALSIVYDGYTALPRLYQGVFLDPLKNLITTEDYRWIMDAINGPEDPNDHHPKGPWTDWMASIDQRSTGYQKDATHAFEEIVADLYDGFLSREELAGIKAPDYETVPPLVKWGRPKRGPYTWPADTGEKLGMKMAVVNMPSAYSKNIALWAAVGHETGGHDVLRAYEGLVDEIGNKVASEIMNHENDPAFQENVQWNGRTKSVAEFAAEYWKYTIDETGADVCGLLNLGPAAGIGLSVLLIPLRGGKLLPYGPLDVHPIDALRLFLAADVIRSMPHLDVNTANAWSDALEGIIDKYILNKSGFVLYSKTQSGEFRMDAKIPYNGMRETVKVVANIAFKPLDTLGGNSLSDINTWKNSDEELTLRIVDDFVNKRQPSLEPGPGGEQVYAAHILSGAVLALTDTPDVEDITALAISALNELYSSNPVWHGFPAAFRSNAHPHNLVPEYGKSVPEHISA